MLMHTTHVGVVTSDCMHAHRGTHILDVRYAQEPGNILWENLEISPKQRR
jgi:hypothetical protein